MECFKKVSNKGLRSTSISAVGEEERAPLFRFLRPRSKIAIQLLGFSNLNGQDGQLLGGYFPVPIHVERFHHLHNEAVVVDALVGFHVLFKFRRADLAIPVEVDLHNGRADGVLQVLRTHGMHPIPFLEN